MARGRRGAPSGRHLWKRLASDREGSGKGTGGRGGRKDRRETRGDSGPAGRKESAQPSAAGGRVGQRQAAFLIPPGGMEKFFPRSRKSPIQKGPFLVYWYHRTCILRDMNFEEVVTYECID